MVSFQTCLQNRDAMVDFGNKTRAKKNPIEILIELMRIPCMKDPNTGWVSAIRGLAIQQARVIQSSEEVGISSQSLDLYIPPISLEGLESLANNDCMPLQNLASVAVADENRAKSTPRLYEDESISGQEAFKLKAEVFFDSLSDTSSPGSYQPWVGASSGIGLDGDANEVELRTSPPSIPDIPQQLESIESPIAAPTMGRIEAVEDFFLWDIYKEYINFME
jgi:hypothetical protein